ncbi:MAG TPA: tail fiber domain-containing protein [bacterium]|nr:tail fiber domain-containing protein [bacterium]
MTRRAIAGILLVCAAALTAYAAVPASITVQGKLTDLSGNPLLAGSKDFTFKIFDAPTLGNEIWPNGAGENQTLTSDAAGLWIGLVGAVVPLTNAVFSDTIRWLEITVNGTTLPRVRLVTGPYAHRVATVDGASGGAIIGALSVGSNNAATGFATFVAGQGNTASGHYSAVDGGLENAAIATHSVVGGGWKDTASGWASVVDGGEFNRAYGLWSTVGGGGSNQAIDQGTTIAGGGSSVARGLNATIGGGANNLTDAPFATLSGGEINAARGTHATIGGGRGNLTYGQFSTIAGGGGSLPHDSNSARGDYSVVVAGRRNHASGFESTIGGGTTNRAAGSGSTIPGGSCNSAVGANSFAAGVGAKSNHPGSFVWNSSNSCADSFVSTAANQFLVRAGGGVGINTTSPNRALTVNGDMGVSGPVGIGTTNPNKTLTVDGDMEIGVASGDYHHMRIGGGNSSGFLYGSYARYGDGIHMGYNYHANAAGNPVVIAPGGGTSRLSLGYGWMAGYIGGTGAEPTTRSFYVEPNGSFRVDEALLVDGLGNFYNGMYIWNGLSLQSGNMLLYGDIWRGGCYANFTCHSDLRLKKNLEPLTDPIGNIQRLRGVRFDWRREEFPDREFPEDNQIGLIAQEVLQVAPTAVTRHTDGYMSVDYAKLVPLLIEGMKEQQKRIEKLEETIRRMQP